MAFGKRNEVNLNPLSYSICLLGESKVGKTTLIKEVCEKLVGDDGYLFMELGSERGADAIQGIKYINCPEWQMEYDELTNSAGFEDVCMDIIENKNSEYPNLKVVVWDTYDHLINLAEQETIRLWNKECRQNGHPEKVTKLFNATWGGFSAPGKKAIELMLGMKAKLKSVGVETIVIGHVKTKDVTDVVSGETYQTLTSDQQQNYFSALKKELHFLGLAYIDRQIVKEKTGKKNIVNGKEEIVSKVSSETRKIKFRDDNYAVDSGSRFENIVSEIPMNADAFIQALTDAIKAEQSKSGVSLKDAEKKQKKQQEEIEARVAKQEEENKAKKELESTIAKIVGFCTENKSDLDKVKPVLMKVKEMGYGNPKEIDDIDDAKSVYEYVMKLQ